MSVQRRRGQSAVVYKTEIVTDARGNTSRVLDTATSVTVRAVFIPQRGAKAEVPGQAQINVIRMIVDPDVEGVDLWSRVDWNGLQWDVVSPPAYHHGTRHTRHWSIDIRQRP